jgi:hypothetical protein
LLIREFLASMKPREYVAVLTAAKDYIQFSENVLNA